MQSTDGCYSHRGGECRGSDVLPVDSASLGCVGSGWVFLRGTLGKDLRI